eukprot:7598443-Pyramimonas_sp.AAC.1
MSLWNLCKKANLATQPERLHRQALPQVHKSPWINSKIQFCGRRNQQSSSHRIYQHSILRNDRLRLGS